MKTNLSDVIRKALVCSIKEYVNNNIDEMIQEAVDEVIEKRSDDIDEQIKEVIVDKVDDHMTEDFIRDGVSEAFE